MTLDIFFMTSAGTDTGAGCCCATNGGGGASVAGIGAGKSGSFKAVVCSENKQESFIN
jgi:hypothetical protein